MSVVRRFQTTGQRTIAWCRKLLADPQSTPHLTPWLRQEDGDVVLWEGEVAPGYRRPELARDLIAAQDALPEGHVLSVDPAYRYVDVRVDLNVLTPLARWLAERRTEFRYEHDHVPSVEVCLGRSEAEQERQVRRRDPAALPAEQANREAVVPAFWPELGNGQSAESWLNEQARNIIVLGARAVRLGDEEYVITAEDRAWAEAHPTTAGARYLAGVRAQEKNLLAERRADPSLIEERVLAREIGVHVGTLHKMRKVGLLGEHVTGPPPCIWYRRDQLMSLDELRRAASMIAD